MIPDLYVELLDRHGRQGWWPVYRAESGRAAYHPGDYRVPEGAVRVEVVAGAILAQNTSWKGASTAVERLRRELRGLEETGGGRAAGGSGAGFGWRKILELPEERLREAVRPSRFFRQKSARLRRVARFYLERRDGEGGGGDPPRERLLEVKGIGPETADSVLLYAHGVPVMVVDAYLRRLLRHRGLDREAELGYEDLRRWVERRSPDDHVFLNELHALVVAEAQRIGREEE